MRQMTYRLECMLPVDDDLPSHAGIDAEHILKTLAAQPSAYLRADFIKVMQNLQGPLNYITNDEVEDLRRLSGVAKHGIAGALDTIVKGPHASSAFQSRLALRIAIATLVSTLDKHSNSEQQIMDALWAEGYNGLSTYLVDRLWESTTVLYSVFSLNIPEKRTHADISSLFHTCLEILHLILRLTTIYPLTSRYITSLTCSIADIFVCSDSADMAYAKESSIYEVAHIGRQSCIEAIGFLLEPPNTLQSAMWHPSTVLKALLIHAKQARDHDVAHFIAQIFWLFENALPVHDSEICSDQQTREDWIRQNLSPILSELGDFYSMLEPLNKVHLMRRLKELDEGCIGIAEWLLSAELQELSKSTKSALSSFADPAQRVALWQVKASFTVLASLLQQASGIRDWALDELLRDEEQLDMLQTCLSSLLEINFCFECVEEVVVALITDRCSDLNKNMRTLLLGTLCRSARCRRFNIFDTALQLLQESDEPLFDERTAQEFGEALEETSHSIGEELEGVYDLADLAETIFHILEKVTPLDNSKSVLVLRGLGEDSLNAVVTWLTKVLPIGQSTKLEAMRLRWTISGEPRASPEFISSSYNPRLLLDQWEDLLKPPALIPSTPRRRSPAQSAEMVGLITVSPPNALLRSPEVKGLTKTYQNNDFRQLRQSSATRQNTSRLPSMHVDVSAIVLFCICLLLIYHAGLRTGGLGDLCAIESRIFSTPSSQLCRYTTTACTIGPQFAHESDVLSKYAATVTRYAEKYSISVLMLATKSIIVHVCLQFPVNKSRPAS